MVALGSATRLISLLPLDPKTYRFGVRFGSQTDTLDGQGTVVKSGGSVPSLSSLEAVIPHFTGAQQQVPPEYSAVKINGRRAYSLARQGRPATPPPRTITVHALRLLRFDEAAGSADLELVCSAGTYVRSLARDIAERLGTFGYASSVRRLAAGAFAVERALPFDRIADAGGALITISEALRGLPAVTVTSEQAVRIGHGVPVRFDRAIGEERGQPVFAFDETRCFVAVLKRSSGGEYRPVKVFTT